MPCPSSPRSRLHAPRPLPSIRFALAATLVMGSSATGCAVSTPDTAGPLKAPPPRQEIETSLAVSVDELAVRHGRLRITASFDEDDEVSPDVSLWLGPSCERREIGQGIATRTGFSWSLGTTDLARTLECNVTVRVRVDTPEAAIHKARTFPVAVNLVDDSDAGSTVDARLVLRETNGATTRLGFKTNSRVTRLRVGSTLIGAEAIMDDDDDARRSRPTGSHVALFDVANDDLARAVLSRRRVTLHGAAFAPVATVGGASLDLADDLPPEPIVEEGRVVTLD